jgi:hypothetical protein
MTNKRLNRGPPSICAFLANAQKLRLQAAPRPRPVNAKKLH